MTQLCMNRQARCPYTLENSELVSLVRTTVARLVAPDDASSTAVGFSRMWLALHCSPSTLHQTYYDIRHVRV